MKINKQFSVKILEELVRFATLNFVYIFFGNAIVSTIDKNAIVNNFVVFSFSLVTTLITFVLFNIVRIFKKSISITVSFYDVGTGRDFETILLYSDFCCKTDNSNKLNRVIAKVDFLITNSLWNYFIYLLLKDKIIELVFCPEPEEAINEDKESENNIYLTPASVPDTIDKYKNGFAVNISKKTISNIKNNVKHGFKFDFSVNLNDESSELQIEKICPMKPYLLINRKPLNVIYKLFIKTNLVLSNGQDAFIINYLYNNHK